MTASGAPPPPPPQMAYPPARPPVQKTAKPVIGGILIILPALGLVFSGVVVATIGMSFFAFFFTLIPGIASFVMICAIVFLILGIIALMGGIFAVMRRHWGLALVGGILTIFSLLGLIGLILVAISKDEFE
ncbi:MAG: hypothetical protein ACE5IO_07335 [Thermoplasmata archaeon]